MFNNKIYFEDLNDIFNDKNIDWNIFKDKSFFITGGTGLIGSLIINYLIFLNDYYNFNIKIYSLVRSKDKVINIFGNDIFKRDDLIFIYSDIRDNINIDFNIDYVIHTASQTSSKKFIDDALGTIDINVNGTTNLLELIKDKNIKKFIYLSTMEVYGNGLNDEKIDENYSINLNSNSVRNSYPISKFMCENICTCYAIKYGFELNILRLTQTFGAGIMYNDSRVFAEFIRSCIERKDIILHTMGDTKRCYLYTVDCVKSIFLTIQKGNNLDIYNVCNEDTYCSILDMAKIVSKIGNIEFKIELDDINKYGYQNTLNMNLDSTKIKELGFKPKYNLEEMFIRVINYFNNMEK